MLAQAQLIYTDSHYNVYILKEVYVRNSSLGEGQILLHEVMKNHVKDMRVCKCKQRFILPVTCKQAEIKQCLWSSQNSQQDTEGAVQRWGEKEETVVKTSVLQKITRQ